MGFAQFIKERKYLSNVSPATIEWYEQSLARYGVADRGPAHGLCYANAREGPEGNELQLSHPRCKRLLEMVKISVARTEAERTLFRSARLFAS